jgi:hypothetical protein
MQEEEEEEEEEEEGVATNVLASCLGGLGKKFRFFT